jgi:predicted alpha/beta superfamily hydrolase
MKQILFILVLFSVTVSNAQSQFLNPEPISSKFLNEERPYLVCLPQSYSDTTHVQKKYPVVLLLDGHYHYWYSISTIDFLSRNDIIPECIIVSVPNTDRTRDLTPTHSITYYDGTKDEDRLKTSGGGENFLKFINEELISTIDKNYNTMKLKVFVGHSFGGLTVTQSFLSNSSPFNAYIAMDPSMWWDNDLCLKQLNSVKSLSNTKSWYMSAANNNEFKIDTTSTRKVQEKFNQLLLQEPNSVRTKLQLYEDENHHSVTLKSLYDGMRFTFSSYRITTAIKEDVGTFKAHFQ